MSAPIDAPAIAPEASASTNAAGPVNDEDVNHWKHRFNDVLSRPSEHINSKSPSGAIGWATSLFSCFSPIDLCLITCCVPCVTFGKIHHRVHKNGNMEGYEPVNTSCLLFCGSGCVGLPCIPASMQRASMREKYNLEGSCVGDLAITFCCGCCNLVQLEKESEYREKLLKEATQKPYKANPDMAYPGN